MHNGMVLRDGEKMSKSEGNVVSVADALKRWSPDALRLFVLTKHYRQPTNLTDEAMAAAARGVERLAQALEPAEGRAGAAPPSALLDAAPFRARFVEAMDDDLNTAQALAALFDLARAINRGREEGAEPAEAQATLRELASVLGLALAGGVRGDLSQLSAPTLAAIASRFRVACGGTDVESTVEALLDRRGAAREERDFALADAIRDALADAGVEVQDGPQGARWSARA
jgi:cysteinyl-tRNA synthetase